jgi:hypothetical protein
MHCPPASQELTVNAIASRAVARPRFLLANKVNSTDVSLVVFIRGLPLVLCIRSAVVSEFQTLPGSMLKILVQQALISTVEAFAGRGHGLQRPVFSHAGRDDHDTAVEGIWPANVWRRCKGRLDIKQLIQSPERHNVGIEVHDLAELHLPPQSDLGKSEGEIRPTHEIQVSGTRSSYALDGDDVVVESLEAGNGVCGQRVERDEDSKLLGGASIAQRVGKDSGSWKNGSDHVRQEDQESGNTGKVGVAHEQLWKRLGLVSCRK